MSFVVCCCIKVGAPLIDFFFGLIVLWNLLFSHSGAFLPAGNATAVGQRFGAEDSHS